MKIVFKINSFLERINYKIDNLLIKLLVYLMLSKLSIIFLNESIIAKTRIFIAINKIYGLYTIN